MTALALPREAVAEAPNPLGLEGVEFVEYRTARPQALGHELEQLGFRPVARHRSREVLRWRQGSMNIVVNAHDAPPHTAEAPEIAALALRVRDAPAAHRRAVERGAWPVTAEVRPMELHVPAVHGVGGSRLYFVDRWREFSVFDVDFVPIPTVDDDVPAPDGLHWFGFVQYVGPGRARDWAAFYGSLFGFAALPAHERFGVLPAGVVLRSPCGSFCVQLVEPGGAGSDGGNTDRDDGTERWQRVAFGSPDVAAVARRWGTRGVAFVDDGVAALGPRGALTRPSRPGGAMFELVAHAAPVAAASPP